MTGVLTRVSRNARRARLGVALFGLALGAVPATADEMAHFVFFADHDSIGAETIEFLPGDDEFVCRSEITMNDPKTPFDFSMTTVFTPDRRRWTRATLDGRISPGDVKSVVHLDRDETGGLRLSGSFSGREVDFPLDDPGKEVVPFWRTAQCWVLLAQRLHDDGWFGSPEKRKVAFCPFAPATVDVVIKGEIRPVSTRRSGEDIELLVVEFDLDGEDVFLTVTAGDHEMIQARVKDEKNRITRQGWNVIDDAEKKKKKGRRGR